MDSKAFRYWLTGFIDGEGCFRIHKEKSGGYYACHFQLKLRADDYKILEKCRDYIGAGKLKEDRDRGRSRPCIAWVIQSRSDCWILAEYLDKYSLRAKKRLEYKVWREALEYWTNMKRGNRWSGPRDWSQMESYKSQIEKLREFQPVPAMLDW